MLTTVPNFLILNCENRQTQEAMNEISNENLIPLQQSMCASCNWQNHWAINMFNHVFACQHQFLP